jgi:hypothetical protein
VTPWRHSGAREPPPRSLDSNDVELLLLHATKQHKPVTDFNPAPSTSNTEVKGSKQNGLSEGAARGAQ